MNDETSIREGALKEARSIILNILSAYLSSKTRAINLTEDKGCVFIGVNEICEKEFIKGQHATAAEILVVVRKKFEEMINGY